MVSIETGGHGENLAKRACRLTVNPCVSGQAGIHDCSEGVLQFASRLLVARDKQVIAVVTLTKGKFRSVVSFPHVERTPVERLY